MGFNQSTTSPAAVTAELKGLDIQGIGATKTFNSISAANSGLEPWIVDLQELFTAQKTEWSMVVSLQFEGTKNEISVTAPTVRMLLPQALAALKILATN